MPGHTEPIHHFPQLSHIPLQRAGQHFLLPTVSQVIGRRPLRQSRQAAINLSVSLFACQSVVFRVSLASPTSTPEAACGRGESGGVSTGHSAYITSTLGPFVLFDPGLLSCFQTGGSESCGGNVQGDAVTGPVCECMCAFEWCFNKRLPVHVL